MTDDPERTTGPDEETKLGRPRDPSLDTAILTATLDLLGEVGYDQVTVRAIAQRSGTGLATLYRRWPTKEDLVVEAVRSFGAFPADITPEVASECGPVEGVVRIATWLAGILQGPRRGLLPNIVGQLPANTRLGQALRDQVALPRLDVITDLLRTVPGADPARVRAAAESIPASIFFQVLILGRDLDEDDVRCIVERAVQGARG